MRSRLGISISVGTLDLIECGPAAEEGQSPDDHIPLYFIAAPSTAARRPSAERFSQERKAEDGTVHISRMVATSQPCRTRYAVASAFIVPDPAFSHSRVARTNGARQTARDRQPCRAPPPARVSDLVSPRPSYDISFM